MTGDISRKTFDRAKDFSLVRMQQGRLFADADWNEQGDILRASDREAAADIIGPAGFPEEDAGFGLLPDAGTGTLVITPGTGYVAGVRHVVRWPTAYTLTRQSGTGGNALWRIDDGLQLADDDVLSTDPAGLTGFVKVRNFAQDANGVRTFRTTPALGDAVTVAFRPANYSRQPYGAGVPLPDVAGDYLAVLKSTDLAVTALDDPLLREVAFDGPDTAYRDRTIWQVVLVSRTALLALGYQAADLTCPALSMGFDPVLAEHAPGEMRARAELSDLSAGACTLPPAAGYRSLDNLLFRVEIHRSGDETTAFYKWSRENAIYRTRYREIDAGVLVVESIGRDEMTALKAGDWIEIRDQAAIYGQAPGFFARIDEVIGQRVSLAELRDPLTLAPLLSNGLPDTAKLPAAAFVTRWEGGLPVQLDNATADWVDLENGVQVRFGVGQYQSGDHWNIPGRAVSGDIEWPRNPATGEPMSKPAEGPRRNYAALAWLTLDGAGAWTVTEDCRPLFPPIIKAKQVLYAGGDGQEALDDPLNVAALVSLPKELSVAVVRGHKPVKGETIRFTVVEGAGRFGNGQPTQQATTDDTGVASVNWNLDSTVQVQRAVAQRLDAAGTPTHAPIAFNATLSRATHISFDPANTPALGQANTVQKAIEALAGLQHSGCTTIVIQPGEDWVARLEGLQPSENASICFARGTYTTARTVRMSGLGHIRISGAGPGTVRIVANRTEAALAFEACASVAVSGLELATPDGNTAVDAGLKTHRQGTLDFGHCDEVEVHGCTLSCGGGTSTERACVTVRGYSETLKTLRVTQSVRITGNSLTVGNLQEGIVVTDAVDVDVSSNLLTAKSGKGSLNIGAFLSDKVWVATTAKHLISRPVKGNVGRGTGFKEIAAKEWRMTFNSPVSQKDWDELVAMNPPAAADLRNQDTFSRWAQGLVASVAEDPDRMPVFRKQLKRVGDSFGTNDQGLDNPKVRTTLLVSSDPVVQRFDGGSGAQRQVVVEANGQVVAFDSAFSQKDWTTLISRSGSATKIANADELLGLSYALAKKVLEDKELRAGLGSVQNWLKGLGENSVSLGAQGIVCGGRRMDNVAIRGNAIRAFQVGVRVAVSHMRSSNVRSRSVSIDDNRMELMAPSAEAYAGYGMMIGNVDTLRIRGNEMALSSRPNFIRYFAQGIRIWGFIGHQVLVAENRISMATMGIRLVSVVPFGEDPHLWVFRENLIEGPAGIRNWKVTPSWPLIDQNNLTRTV
ncbi:DUF6519 domain-containing protein [Ensifer sp. 1H6]|uniref:DUF6519 domain-containing protein n=1 Tax=Ensifer sp. 1H6 TaxID=1911585 RepID=UPI0009D3B4C6|nr:DUF6519 domain-containing protein [Ensifer sp. 1H6]OMQ35362.1 hypothetical protein BKP54_32175 [Ensifer sp. 1H6]